MTELRGVDNTSGRHLFSLHVSHLAEYPEHLELASPRFVLFLCADGRVLDDTPVLRFGLRALTQGAAYFCVWGPDCERIHHLLDTACMDAVPNESDDTVIMTTAHKGESLPEALWFAINLAWPASAYEDACRTVLALTVESSEWDREIVGWLTDLPALNEEWERD